MKYYNPEPSGASKNDCTIRSITAVTGQSYEEIKRQLNIFKKVTHAKFYYSHHNPHRFVEDILNAKKITIENDTTIADFCKTHPRGRYILDLDAHWSACIDGRIYDTWDCRKEKLNFAYEVTTLPYTPPNLKQQVFKYCCTSERISNRETRIRIYDGNGNHVERVIPVEYTAGYVLCLQHSNYHHIELQGEPNGT